MKANEINFMSVSDYIKILEEDTERNLLLRPKLINIIRKDYKGSVKDLRKVLLSELDSNMCMHAMKKKVLLGTKPTFENIGMYHVYFK